jgi:hypothetical protein
MHMVDFDAMFSETFYCTSGFAKKNKLSSFNLLQGFEKFKFLVIFNEMQKHGCYNGCLQINYQSLLAMCCV